MFFNEKPKTGIDFCIKHKLLSEDDVCNFLLKTKGLSKYAIGEYLAEPNSSKVLK